MENYILNTHDGFSFGPDYKQIFQNKPVHTLMHEEIIRMRHNGLITDDDLKVVKFIFDFRFVTPEIIASYLNTQETVENIKNRLDKLVKNRILNKFMLSMMPMDSIPPNALCIYCLDLGGKTLLSQYSTCDIANWTTAKTHWSSENIGYDLVTAKFYIQLMNTCGSKVEYFKSNPEYRINKHVVIPSFEFCLKIGGVRKYFIGQIVRDFDIPIGFRNQSENLESILCTKAWMKYFHDANGSVPVLFLVGENDEVALEAGRIISTVSGIAAFRLTTDERMNKPLNEGGAFLKYNKEKDCLQAIKASTFDPE
jgi:hypothetical protein